MDFIFWMYIMKVKKYWFVILVGVFVIVNKIYKLKKKCWYIKNKIMKKCMYLIVLYIFGEMGDFIIIILLLYYLFIY